LSNFVTFFSYENLLCPLSLKYWEVCWKQVYWKKFDIVFEKGEIFFFLNIELSAHWSGQMLKLDIFLVFISLKEFVKKRKLEKSFCFFNSFKAFWLFATTSTILLPWILLFISVIFLIICTIINNSLSSEEILLIKCYFNFRFWRVFIVIFINIFQIFLIFTKKPPSPTIEILIFWEFFLILLFFNESSLLFMLIWLKEL